MDFPGVIQVGVLPPTFEPFWFGGVLAPPAVDCNPGPRHSWLVPPGTWMPGPLMALHLRWVCWGEARYSLPYPNMCSSTRMVVAPHVNTLTFLPFRSRLQSLMGSPCQTMATVRQHILAIILGSCQYAKIASVSKSWSTPSGMS